MDRGFMTIHARRMILEMIFMIIAALPLIIGTIPMTMETIPMTLKIISRVIPAKVRGVKIAGTAVFGEI